MDHPRCDASPRVFRVPPPFPVLVSLLVAGFFAGYDGDPPTEATDLIDGGNVQVTAYGPGSAQCKVENWGSVTANVRCFRPNGTLIGAPFTVLYGS